MCCAGGARRSATTSTWPPAVPPPWICSAVSCTTTTSLRSTGGGCSCPMDSIRTGRGRRGGEREAGRGVRDVCALCVCDCVLCVYVCISTLVCLSASQKSVDVSVCAGICCPTKRSSCVWWPPSRPHTHTPPHTCPWYKRMSRGGGARGRRERSQGRTTFSSQGWLDGPLDAGTPVRSGEQALYPLSLLVFAVLK
jgi:hypothetical protein